MLHLDGPHWPVFVLEFRQVVAEFEANGFQADGEMTELPWQHLLFFRPASD